MLKVSSRGPRTGARVSRSIRLVSPREAVENWDWYEEQINRVIDRANAPHWPDDLLTCVQLGTMQLWRSSCGRGMALTEVQEFPRYKRFLVYIVAGYQVREWLAQGHHDLQDFAKSLGCHNMEFHGRSGWEPYVRELGYTRKMIRMTKDL